MTELRFWAKEILILLEFSLLLALSFLLIAVFVRPLMIVAVVGIFSLFVLSLFSTRVRHWIEAPTS